MGLVASQHVGSSWARAQTRVPCIGRQILNHCATREVPSIAVLQSFEDSNNCCLCRYVLLFMLFMLILIHGVLFLDVPLPTFFGTVWYSLLLRNMCRFCEA